MLFAVTAKKVAGSISIPRTFLCGVCMVPLCLPGYYQGHCTHHILNMHIEPIGKSEFDAGLSVTADGYLSLSDSYN